MSDNTASNLGTGQGIFAQKVGDDLQFKSLIGGTNVTLSADANNITITASNDTTALNLGTGSGLFTTKSGDNLQLKSLIANAASGISVTSNANDLTFQLVQANVDAGKLGGVSSSDYLRKSDNLASVASTATARSNLSVYSKAEIDANVIRNNQDVLPTADSTWSLGSNSYKWLNIYADNFYGRASVAGSIGALNDINNVNVGSASNNDIIKYNSSSSNWETGTLSLLNLSDTPANYTGSANKFLRVNSSGNGVEFATGVATETYVTNAISNLVGGAPGALDTLNELAEALNDDASFSTTITNSLANKENSVSPGTTSQYYRGDKTFQNLTSDVVSEGSTNLYHTTARVNSAFDTRFGSKNTDNLSEGSSNLYFTNTRWDSRFGTKTTDNLTEGSSNLYYTTVRQNSDFDTRLASKDTGNLTEGSNLYFTNARADARIGAASIDALSDVRTSGSNAPSDAQALVWDNVGGYWKPGTVSGGGGGGSGDIEGVVAGTGLTGGGSTGTVTLNADVGTTANKILQLDGSAKIPAVDGSQLTNITYTPGADSITDTMIDFGTGGGQVNTADIPEVTNLYFTNARADARIGAASINALSDVNTSGVSSGQVLKWSGTAWTPGADTSPADTDALSEGSTNLYFTNARVDSHLNQSNPTAGYVLSWNGSDYAWVDNGAATPGGSNTQVQFNDGGSFAGDSGFTYNKTTDELTVGSVTTTGSSPNLSAAGNLGITTTASNGNITITPHNTGDIVLDGQKWPQADGSANQYLKTNGSGQLSWDTLTTSDVAEGSNQYFTNARAISAITGSDLDMGGKKVLFGNLYSAEGDLPNASTYHGMFAHVHGTGAGYFAHAGNWVKLANNSQLANSSNWDTAYGWGNHASAGYGTLSNVVEDTTPQLGGNLDVQSSMIKSSGDNVMFGEGISASGITGTGASRIKGFAAYFGRTSDNSQRHYNTGWYNKQTLSANIDANNKKQGWLTNTELDAAGYTHGTDSANDIGKLFGDYSYTTVVSNGSSATINGAVGHSFFTEIMDTSANPVNASHLIGIRARAVNGKAGSTVTNAYGLYVGTDKDGSATITNRYSVYAPVADDKAYFAGQVQVGAWTLPNTDGSNGQILKTDGSGNVTWQNDSGGPADTDALSEGSTNLYFTNGRADARIGAANIADLNNVNNAAPSDGQVLTWDNSNSYWKPVAPAGGTDVQRFKINYATNGNLSSISDETSGISSVSIDSATGGDITINFTGYNYPPASITLYGYNYPSNKYNVNPLNKDITLREIPGGGSSGSPTAFGSFSSVKIKASENDSGASRSFGTVTHAWVQVVMGG